MVVKMKMVHCPFGPPPPKVMSEITALCQCFCLREEILRGKPCWRFPREKQVQQQFFHVIKKKKKMSKKKKVNEKPQLLLLACAVSPKHRILLVLVQT